jgi:NAD(P)H-nitrite reductase large subunit
LHIVIIGNGAAGVSAAVRIRERQPDWRITLISGESDYHYSRPALMYVFMGHMRYADCKPFADNFWDEQKLERMRDWVTAIDPQRKSLSLARNGELQFDRLLIATGSKSNKFGWPGQDLNGVQGLYDLRDLRLLYENSKNCENAIIVGGGLIGIELAEMLHSRGIHVRFLVREVSYWDNVLPAEESGMINELIRRHGFGLELETELGEVVDDGDGRVRAVRTGDGREFECQLVGLTAGVSPNVDVVAESGIELGRGVIVDSSFRTSAEDIFAAGDCAEIRERGADRGLIQQVWYTGKAQGAFAGDIIAGGSGSYDSGIWYNSAKFLNLEYQTYGDVNRRIDGEESLYWEHPDGMHACRIVHVGGRVIGFNFMGLRARHRVCERWIAERATAQHVLANLDECNFDPEFFARHEHDIRSSMEAQLSARGAAA